MALLVLKDKDGKVITEVPTIKGDKGDTGATGATGKDGVSITKTEINNKGELIITLSDNTVSNLGVIVGAKGDKGDKGDGYILTDMDKSEIAARVSGDCVSYLEAQNLTDEQKKTARDNIGAVSQDDFDSAVIDGIVVKDTTNSVDYIAKLRLVDGKPVIEYDEI